MRIYQIYDTKDHDLFIMRGTANYIARQLGVTPRVIRQYCIEGILVKKRYKVYLENTDDE